jgi:DNA mismatch endonuclease (patch repair protein)
MSDSLTQSERSERMALVRSKDTGPEMVVRRLIHGMGLRYRLHDQSLSGKPDLVFRPKGKAIFVHGCFWHRHPDANCRLARMPKSRLDFWRPKLEQNRLRDERNRKNTADLNWEVLTI